MDAAPCAGAVCSALRLAQLLLLIVACSCSRGGFPDANLVVIGIDTLRADHLGCYGYARPTTPRIDALAEESVVFTTAVSQSPWTLPAFASMFTGLLPSSHRAGEGKMLHVSSLDPGRDTLATVLQRASYRTGMFSSNGYVSKDVGLASGFDDANVSMRGAGATEKAIAWLRAHAGERFFLFLHIVDPHQPYAPPPEHAAPFIDPGYEGTIGMQYGGWADPTWNDADRRRIIDLYDGDVHFSDSLVGRVLDTLAALGVRERTVIAVTSDHGEELLDHSFLGHGHTLYDELLLVPLIVHFPGGQPRGRVEHQVRTMDLFPTLLEMLALRVPDGLDAVSLLPMARGEAPNPETDRAFAEYLFNEPELKAIRQGDRKLILDPAAGTTQLFDLRADPREREDISTREPERLAELRVALEHRVLASVEGFHLRLRGGRKAHRLEAIVRTTGRFEDVALYNPEADDRYTVAEDGRLLDVTFAVGAREHRAFMNVDVDDEDGIRFRTAGGAPVDVTLRLDDAPMPGAWLQLGASDQPQVDSAVRRFDPRDRRLMVPFPRLPVPAKDGELRAALVFVQRPPPPLATMSDKTRESLRALGYIE
jgi:arylsulfatase A-like enzyme